MKHLKNLFIAISSTFLIGSVVFIHEYKQDVFDNPIKVDTIDDEISGRGVRWEPSYTPYEDDYSSKQYISMNHVGDLETVWNKYTGEGITIAVIDSGIDYDHPDFVNDDGVSNLRDDGIFMAHVTYASDGKTINKINTDGTGTPVYFQKNGSYTIGGVVYSGKQLMLHEWTYVKSKGAYAYNAHGTNVAGTAAAALNHYTKTGTVGIAPKAKILPIKCDFYMDSVGYAINYCAELNKDSDPTNDVHIINMSIEATSGYSSTYNTKAVNNGITLIAAAGNSNYDTTTYPASSSNVIGIGALASNSSTQKASFSNYNSTSATSTSNNNVDIVAPGYVYTPDYAGPEGAGYSSYTNTSGTSFSSPIIAGAAALYYQKYKDYYSGSTLVSNCYTAMKNACVDIGDSGWDRYFGFGRLDISSFVGTYDITSTTSVSIDQTNPTIYVGVPVQLTATISPSTASSTELKWYTASSYFEVSHSGIITGKSSGSGLVYCETLDGHKKASTTVTVDSSIIAVESVELVSPESCDTIELDAGDTLQISYLVSPSNATDKSVLFESDEPSIASVSNTGLVTAISDGSAYISVTSVANPSLYDFFEVVVIGSIPPEEDELISITLNSLPLTVPFMNDAPDVSVTANYKIGASKDVTSSATINNIDTSVLGNQTLSVSYTESGATKTATKDIKVTNNGADGNIGEDSGESWSDPQTTVNTATGANSIPVSSGATSISYTVSGSSGYEDNRGIQWSKASGSITSTSLGDDYLITSVVVDISSNSTGATIYCKVGGANFGTQGQAVSNSNHQTKSFLETNGAIGAIVISTTASGKSVWIKSITVTYKVKTGGGSTDYKATPEEQALAWAIYFNSFKQQYCNESGIGSDIEGLASVWGELGSEYTYMIDDSKDAFFESDNATITMVRNDYRYIYATYGSQLGENFVKDSSGGNLNAPISPVSIIDNKSALPIIVLVALTSVSSIGAIIYFRKRKEQ